MKFSIVIPVYNVELYLDKCLKSVINQSYDNFEVIIVNDGTKDNSQKIIDKYTKKDKRFKGYIKENGGLSSARNYGLKYCTGDYLLFIDSDDYIDKDLLSRLNEVLQKKKVDIVRFNCVVCDTDDKILSRSNDIEYIDSNVNDIIIDLIRRDFVEPAWLYCYKISFWEKNKFKYQEGKIHEDFGLTPLILYYANSITSINYDGYYYVQRDGSITKTKSYDKIKKAVFDFIEQYEIIINTIEKENNSLKKDAIITYISECVIYKCKDLNKSDFDEYVAKLKQLNVTKRIVPLTFKKRIKKFIASISIKLYINLFKSN